MSARENSTPAPDEPSGTTGDAAVSAHPTAIQVVVGCDDGYARHLTVMLLSLFAHCTTGAVQVHVLVPPNFAARTLVDQALGRHSASLAYRVVADRAVRNLKQRNDLTAATYFRLLIGDALPPGVQRVIYLDCDTMVCCDLVELWQVPLGDMVLAAALDPGFTDRHILGLPDDAPYFNAGVLLIDLARWRREAVGEAALDFAVACHQRLTYNDQCALNWILRNRWVLLDPSWNLQALDFGYLVNGELEYRRPVPPIAARARIVHFNSPGRPWFYMDNHPFKPDYLSWVARTPWRDERPVDRYPHNMAIKTLRRHAPILLPAYHHLRRYV